MRLWVLLLVSTSATALQLRPCAARTAAARPALARQSSRILLAEEGNDRPADESLIQFSTLSEDYQKVCAPREAPPHSLPLKQVSCPITAQVVLRALEQRNKERILSGMPGVQSG